MHLATAAAVIAVVGAVAVIGSFETVRDAMSTNKWLGKVRLPFSSRGGEDIKDASAVEHVVTVSGNMNH
jgi:hypothetical protein